MTNEHFESVWDALADTSAEAADLKARSELMMQITQQIKSQGWGLNDVAKRFNATQREIQPLLNGCLAKFNLKDLEVILATLQALR